MSEDQKNNRIFDKLDKIDEKFDRKLDKLDSRIDAIDRDLIVYNEQLKHHIEGVKQLERENNLLKNYIDIEIQKIGNQFQPVVDHVNEMKSIKGGLYKVWKIFKNFWAGLSILAGLIYTIIKIFTHS